jgi:MYXO-CTERM domain-containing protein
MKRALMTFVAALSWAAPGWAVSPYFEDFETGSDGWTIWPGAVSQLNLDTSHNHTPGYTPGPDPDPLNPPPQGHSYRHSEAEPGGFASYTTVADGTGSLRLDAYLWTDNAAPDADDAIGQIQLTSGPDISTDFVQFGWHAAYGAGAQFLSVRTASAGIQDTGVPRPAVNDWIKLSIEADAGVGGSYRFYLNDALIWTVAGGRLDANLDTIRLGSNFGNNHDTAWYDDVRLTPEPGALALLGLGALALRRRHDATA